MPTAEIADARDPIAIELAARIIRGGGLVAFPTETVYGLGADAGNPLAVARIFEVKQRPRIDPVIIHVADLAAARIYGRFPAWAPSVAQRFWPGPLTMVVERNQATPPIVTAGLDTVAIRVPAHAAALDLIRAAGCGIAAPSANLFGFVSPTTAAHVAEQLSDRIDLILDGGACSIGVESTIISTIGARPSLLRAGGIPLEELEEALGPIDISMDAVDRPQAPGQLKKHYATRTPLSITDRDSEESRRGEKTGLLTLTPPTEDSRYEATEILSSTGDLREAAANLFAALRRLDILGLDRIVARPVPESGLGRAIMDRLRRCAVRDE